MSPIDTSRNLLFGLLALQNNFIDRAALLDAFSRWVCDKACPLSAILMDLGALTLDEHALLEALVVKYLERFNNDPEKSLAALSPIGSVREDLSRIADPEIQASLVHAALAKQDRTDDQEHVLTTATVGHSTSAGSRFVVLRPHAEGGLGQVFVARDTELNRDVALKEIRPQFADNPVFRSRFEFEAEVTGGLEHPGIVPVYGLGHMPDGRPFYAMRFIKGNNLLEAIRRFHAAEKRGGRDPGESTIDLRKLLGRFIDVCDAIAYAHSRGILHRDLKPGNIMLGKYGETLVVDWGLAKAIEPKESETPRDLSELPLKPSSGSDLESTVPGQANGTIRYMSPEQAEGRLDLLGPRSDVYSMGATLYHLLTGHAPLEADRAGDVPNKVLSGDIPRPRSINSRVAPALEAVCRKAMAVKPLDRYETVETLKADVERWLADEPVGAYPEPLPARALRWVRHNKPWVVAAATLFLITLAGLAVHDWQIGQEKLKTADQLVMTRTALRNLFQVAGEKLAEVPNSEVLRHELAEQVLENYRDLVSKFPNDSGVKMEMAHVNRVIAGMARLTGQFAESDKSCLQAMEILTSLCATEPDPFEYRRWLAEATRERAELYSMNGLTSQAKELVVAAIAHCEKLLIRPIGVHYRRAKAPALIDLSEILVLENRHREARQAADEAVELLKPIALSTESSKRRSRDRWYLCMALTSRGAASKESGDLPVALQDFRDAEALAKEVIAEDETYNDDLQLQLVRIDNHRAKSAGQASSSPAEAEPALERALVRLAKLIEQNKLMPHFREEQAIALSSRAEVRLGQHRFGEAEADCQTVIDLLEHLIQEQARIRAPENPHYLSLAGEAKVLAGRIHDAQGHAQQGRILRDEGIENLRRACEIDPGRAKDREALKAIDRRAENNQRNTESR